MSLVELFLTFVYVGAFTIGGGLVAITLMQQEIVGAGLITAERFVSMIAISESTPGPIGINMATYIGYEMYGFWGGVLTTCGTVLPSLVVIIVIARYLSRFQEHKGVRAAFYGLRAGTTGMIAVAAFQVLQVSVLTLPSFRSSGRWTELVSLPAAALFIVTFILYRRFRWHPILFILAGAVFGIFFL